MTVGILIPIPREFVLTAAANTLAGAELYVYQNLTTMPVTLYSDRACTTPAANPIVSVAGFFPRRYMASAQLLTLTMKNTAGSTIHSDDYVDPGYGSVHQGALFNPVYDLALTTAGGTTAYTATTGLSLTAYTSGQSFLVKMNATNTGASTLNVDALGAKDITKSGTLPLAAGDLVSGHVYRMSYDGTRFQVHEAVGSQFSGFIYGLTLSNNGSDATNDIDIATGVCADGSNAKFMALTSSLTKRLDASWAVGTGNGGLDTGSIADTTYHVWLIMRSDTGVVDALFSTSASSPTMPANYDYKRRIGSIMRASSTIRPFTQRGDHFHLKTPVRDYSADNPGTSAVLRVLTVPLGLKVRPIHYFSVYPGGTAGTVFGVVTDPDNTDVTPSSTIFTVYGIGTTIRPNGTLVDVFTNTSGQIRTRFSASASGDFAEGMTHGWIDTRGRLS